MQVSASYLNSIDLRPASQPYSTKPGEYEYVRKYLIDDVLRVQLVVIEMMLNKPGYGDVDTASATFCLLNGLGALLMELPYSVLFCAILKRRNPLFQKKTAALLWYSAAVW
jgi:hypothetical protein